MLAPSARKPPSRALITRGRAALLVAALSCAGCAGSTTIPYPRRDQGVPVDLPLFDTHSWLGDLRDAPPACAATCATGCCTPAGSCETGTIDALCGQGGGLCQDCTTAAMHCEAQTCKACQPVCAGKRCGDVNGCGAICQAGSGCCTRNCQGVVCGQPDGCGGSCDKGSGCCTPACGGKLCGDADGCGGACTAGSGCCTPGCKNKQCGASDGCGDTCSGSCDWGFQCNSAHSCVCGPSPHFKDVAGTCLPSCGQLLGHLGASIPPGSCCPGGCNGANGGDTWDCNTCCINGCQ